MTPEVKRINDELAKTLGLCKGNCELVIREHRHVESYCNVHQTYLVNDARTGRCDLFTDVPDLTSAEGHLLLEKTLRGHRSSRNAHYNIDIRPDRIIVYEIDDEGMNRESSDDPDLAIALVKAAHKLLVKE